MHSDTLDANLIIHFIVGDNAAQRSRIKRLLDTPSTFHHLENITIAEVVYVLNKYYGLTREDVFSALNIFLSTYSHCIVYNHDLLARAFPFYINHPSLSFEDCCLASLAEINNAEPLFTFDKKLATQHPSAKLLT